MRAAPGAVKKAAPENPFKSSVFRRHSPPRYSGGFWRRGHGPIHRGHERACTGGHRARRGHLDGLGVRVDRRQAAAVPHASRRARSRPPPSTPLTTPGASLGDGFTIAGAALRLQGTALSARRHRIRTASIAAAWCSTCSACTASALPRVVRDQYHVGRKVVARRCRAWRPRVLRHAGRRGESHVGIVMGGDRFVHVPTRGNRPDRQPGPEPLGRTRGGVRGGYPPARELSVFRLARGQQRGAMRAGRARAGPRFVGAKLARGKGAPHAGSTRTPGSMTGRDRVQHSGVPLRVRLGAEERRPGSRGRTAVRVP